MTATIETPVTSAWRAPGFRRLAAAWVFTNLGDSMLYLMVAVWVKELTGSDVAAAFVFVSLGIPAVLAPFLGMLADRVSRKRLLVAANALLVPIVLSLTFMDSPDRVWIAYVVILLYSSCGYLTGAAQSGLVRGMLSDEQLPSANGTLSTIDNGLRLLAPLIGTGLYVWVGPLPVVALTAACFAVTAAILTGLASDVAPERTAHRGYMRELVAGFEHIARVAPLRWVTISIAVAFGATGLLNVIVFAVLDGMNASPATIGWLMPIQGAGAVAGGILSARIVRALGEGRAAALGMILLAIGMVPLVGGSVALAAPGMIVMGFGIPIAVVAFATLRQRMTPDELQGRTSAAGNVAINLPQTIVSIIGAGLLITVDYRVLIWVTIAAVVAGALIALAARRTR